VASGLCALPGKMTPSPRLMPVRCQSGLRPSPNTAGLDSAERIESSSKRWLSQGYSPCSFHLGPSISSETRISLAVLRRRIGQLSSMTGLLSLCASRPSPHGAECGDGTGIRLQTSSMLTWTTVTTVHAWAGIGDWQNPDSLSLDVRIRRVICPLS
jgi:hypothetical protein